MSPSEMKRLTLFEKLIDVFGEEPAVTLMENLPPGGWDQVASKTDLQTLKTEVNAKMDVGFAKMDGQFAEVNAKMDGQFAEVNAKMDGQFAEVRGEFAKMDGQFAEIRGEFAKMDGRFAKMDGRFAEVRGDMKAMEGRIDRQVSREIRNFAFATMGMILAATTPIWVTLLVNPIG